MRGLYFLAIVSLVSVQEPFDSTTVKPDPDLAICKASLSPRV